MGMEKRGLFKNIINILLDILMVLFGIILLISIYTNVQIHILGNKYSSFFGYSNFEVQTGSMEPTISAGDWIIVKANKNVKLDDIVTYEKEGEFITHRVIEAYRGTYITKGDANNSKDEAISQDQIVGTVVKILPGFGIIRKTIFNPVVLIALIITLYLLGFALKGNKKTDKESFLQKFFETKLVPNKEKKIKVKKEKPVQAIVKEKPVEVEEVETEEVEEESVAELVEDVQDDTEEVVEEVETPEQEEINEDLAATLVEPLSEEELSKTMFFRMVNVDKEELNSNSIEIPQQEVEETLEETNKVEEEEEKSENSEVADKIKLIQNRRKKYKNIIDKVIYIKTEELNEIIAILNNNDRYKVNESTIKDELLKDYIDGKYYNYCGNVNVEYNGKNIITRIDSELKAKGDALIKGYKGNDSNYNDKVKKFVNIFLLINSLEEYFRKDEDSKAKKDNYSNKISKYLELTSFDLKNVVSKILKVQKVYAGVVSHLINEQASSTFQLEFSKITGHKNLIGADLNHNIQFSKVYSDYIVNKTYNDGTVAEDKSIILVNLLLVEVLKDMYAGDFFKNYIIPIAGSIYSKSTKMERTFDLLGDEYAKKNIIVLVEYQDLIENKKVLKALKKAGYRFAVVFRNGDVIKDKDQKMLSICDYAFVDKKETNILNNLPEELKGSVINDDILKKLNVDGGK